MSDGTSGAADNLVPQGQMPPVGFEDPWDWVKARSVAGVEALIRRRQQLIQVKAVSNTALEIPERRLLIVENTVEPPRAGWSEQMFFLKDAETTRRSAPQLIPVFLKYEPRGRRIVLDVTREIRDELGSIRRVHVVCSDDLELDLLRQLLECLRKATRAPRVADLWTSRSLEHSVPVDGVNNEQAQAFSAMTAGGGWLVWGPPGTGKTTVIGKAVADALARGRSVLIASHTHVAVDNVVKDLASVVSEAGSVVRVGSPEKADPEVVAHDWLMLDKAAAVITDRVARLRDILDRQRANERHSVRGRLDTVIRRLVEADLDMIEKAYVAREYADKCESLANRLEEMSDELDRLEERLGDVLEAASVRLTIADRLPLLFGQRDIILQRRTEAERFMQTQQAFVDELIDEQELLRRRMITLSRAVQASPDAGDEFERTLTAVAEIGRNIAEYEPMLDDLRVDLDAINNEVEHYDALIIEAGRSRQQVEMLWKQAEEMGEARNRFKHEIVSLSTEIEQARAIAETVPRRDSIIARAEAEGILALIDERDDLNAQCGRLDAELKELDNEKRRLDDEYADTKRRLLDTAPVIACTLTALTTQSELAGRRFDTVIVDEAASAQIGQLVYAGSKADRCLAFVGDFLQNSPITDTDDAIGEEQQRLLPWQRDDIFALLGIHDRATATSHPRCIALRTQYRYPPVIADIVNEFCYDGLLRTSWTGLVENPVITFVDTSGHPGQELRPEDSSWVHPLGLRLLDPLYGRRGAGSIGMVCPYRAHARRADGQARDRGYGMPCGTSHRFQGRQFDTVIVDLMQDANQARWVAGADLHGNRRQVSAAKLLNVAITRAKRSLFLIGDWNFVRRSTSPGMKAIARLEGRPEFTVIRAADIFHDGISVPARSPV
ncbi:DEAD/DEAH box helicase [Nocardia sp. alder85J]|uniref:DEAD/DEAH box helicase n=1 Tax=Nocardia sp. alder85J TaxID=2862949 RepID=UPI001CD2DAB2|nr:AAA domain-containing protein [Nocardia sp. alder85J]MCX4092085.1 AAA domain-containing protein [Nocardia sp. alder85J]